MAKLAPHLSGFLDARGLSRGAHANKASETNSTTENADIDLSVADNQLLRQEMLALCKDAIGGSLVAESFSYPHHFGGEPPMLEALAAFFNTYFSPSIPVLPTHVVAAAGAGNCLDALIYSLCEPGDSVLVPGPCFDGFGIYCQIHAHVNVILASTPTLGDSFTTNGLLGALRMAYSTAADPTRIKALIMTNPHNPCARCYPEEVLRQCMTFCRERGLHFISDEVYAMCTFQGLRNDAPPFVSALALLEAQPKLKEELEEVKEAIDPSYVHVLWSTSKDLGLAGMRMACVISQANQKLLDAIAFASLWQTSALSSNCLTAILTSPNLPVLLGLNSTRLANSCRLVVTALQKWGVNFIPPSAGLFVFARLVVAKTWEEEAGLVERLKGHGVLVSAGRKYQNVDSEKGWVRITFSVEEKILMEALRRIERCLF